MVKKRFTWLDGLCIVLVLLVILGAMWYFVWGKDVTSGEQQYEVTLRFTQTTVDPYDFYKVGDLLYFYTRSDLMGTITSLSSMDKVGEDYDSNAGTFVKVVDQQWKTIEMKVQVKGAVKNGTFYVNGEEVTVGKTFYPQTNTTRSAMLVWNIEEVDA